MLNGPALAGEGVNQDQVDAVLAGANPIEAEAPQGVADSPPAPAPAVAVAKVVEAEPAAPKAPKLPEAKPVEGDAALLNGPALPGEGVSQDDVDAMLSGDSDVADTAAAAPTPPEAAPAPAVAEAKPQPLAAAPPPKPPVAEPLAADGNDGEEEPSKKASQADIDALFD